MDETEIENNDGNIILSCQSDCFDIVVQTLCICSINFSHLLVFVCVCTLYESIILRNTAAGVGSVGGLLRGNKKNNREGGGGGGGGGVTIALRILTTSHHNTHTNKKSKVGVSTSTVYVTHRQKRNP